MTGIYCIECTWGDNYSVKGPLSLVTAVHGAPMIHRVVGSSQDFEKSLTIWSKRIMKNVKYAVLYLGFHGFAKGLQVGKDAPLRNYVRWEQIADLVADLDPGEWRWEQSLIHFGACSTMDAADSDLEAFLKETRVEAISGYTRDVGWMASTAFDLMYLDALLTEIAADEIDGVEARTARLCRDRLLNSAETKDFATSLGFRMVTKDDFGWDD